MDAAKQLQRIAERLRGINTDSPADAERYIQRHTGDAARQIQPHWATIIARAGIDWTGLEPFPADEPSDPVTDLQLWALAWQSIARVLWFAIRGHHRPGMPQFATVRREAPTEKRGALNVSTITHNAGDWRERAGDYAEICNAVADWLSDSGGVQDPGNVTAARLANHAGCTEKKIRDVLASCPATLDKSGRKSWRYCDALPILRDWCEKNTQKRFKATIWPDIAAHLNAVQKKK